MSDDIAAFVRARLTEWEQTARQATEGPWIAEVSGETGHCVIPADAQSTREHVAKTQLYAAAFDAEHIAAHDPARVLRQVAAMRAVVDWHDMDVAHNRGYAPDTEGGTLLVVLAHLATIWQDHPDYRPGWAPDVG